jgi:hypothetical protein
MLLKVKPIDKKETNRIRRVLIPSRTTVEEPSCLRALLEALLGLEKLIAATGGLFCNVLCCRDERQRKMFWRSGLNVVYLIAVLLFSGHGL